MKNKIFSLCVALLTGVSVWADDVLNVYVYGYCSTNVDTFDIRLEGVENGHEWVNLGLPSGTKWALCNVGADTPEEYGNYYAWGEVTTKEDFSWSTYKWANGTDVEDPKLTKYCTNPDYGNEGFTDNKSTLDLEDDAAHVNWGGSWRMPTMDEIDELLNNCTWTWTTQNGVNGYLVTSNTNSNSIFLPAAGMCVGCGGFEGFYRSSSLYDGTNCFLPFADWFLRFSSGTQSKEGQPHIFGLSVRPVCH